MITGVISVLGDSHDICLNAATHALRGLLNLEFQGLVVGLSGSVRGVLSSSKLFLLMFTVPHSLLKCLPFKGQKVMKKAMTLPPTEYIGRDTSSS